MTSEPLDLTPVEQPCLRCQRPVLLRFAGMCPTCRDELRATFDVEGRDISVPGYEPKRNVTPNSVATRDD
ncbi:MAG TPA: hypothetical protein VLV81_05525 [Acidimicrobiia bacterium]|nr:hypothetical protein [Acidimicrobiia bacterium]